MPERRPGLHNMMQIPEGMAVGDILPSYSTITSELYVGKPNAECAGCRKPFCAVRKRRKAVRMYPIASPVPMAFSFDICGRCVALHEQGGAARDGVLAAVEAYCEGLGAKQ